eukprot:CAMPEP_0194146540 /NCGR_PEP_ID=MMETSP0152-20130528/20841_1 /TAXON_ID=1049557 /ORGANISM="Thalassiothrix antarctica, Strain L6-D1" /LENGTH=149 /DNA_ID=CAMNT_0038847083 /DNA_START=54 /DNA_END=503 /DNA_ORIENTATION=-
MKIYPSLAAVFLLFSVEVLAGSITNINGVSEELEFTDTICSGSESTAAQCPVAQGPLCTNNKCATTTGSCNADGNGCLDLMGAAADCIAPANKCGDGYCGTPPVYDDCQCKDKKCYEIKFVPGATSSAGTILLLQPFAQLLVGGLALFL